MNIYKRKSKKTGKAKYGVDYKDPAGNRVQRLVADDLKTARLVGAKIATEMVMGKYYDRDVLSPVTVRDLVKRYEEYFSLKKSAVTEAYHLVVIRNFFGDMKLVSSITEEEVQNFLRIRRAVIGVKGTLRSNATVNRELWCLKRVLYKAVDWRIIQVNPAANVEPLEEPKKRVSYLTVEQARSLIESAKTVNNKILAAFIMTALDTGMRKSEILGMRPRDIDWAKKRIHIPQAKNGKSRYVPISDRLEEVLAPMHRLFEGCPDIRTSFDVAKTKAGIPEDFRVHDLRHTFVTHMLDRGTPINVVADIVGHSLVSMVERYGHVLEGRQHNAVNELPDWA